MTVKLIVFSRYPRLGRVKTRLSKVLTAEECLNLHWAMLTDTLDRMALLQWDSHLFLGDCSIEELSQFQHKIEGLSKWRLHLQEGSDLGERMWHAYRKVAKGSKGVIFLGSDTPSVPLSYLRQALKKLCFFSVVIGPSEDGGYYLLALSQARKNIFKNISWGTPNVLKQTKCRLNTNEYCLLPQWYDVDDALDLQRLKGELDENFGGPPSQTKLFLRQVQLNKSSF